ncbi:MAG: M20 family metallopeptidase [Solobacterium sp.]|nr:M20 family metallopeptidase [Solobacterium sp.]
MLQKILNDIDEHRDEAIEGLLELIRTESSDGKATKAQEPVIRQLQEMGFAVDCFRQEKAAEELPDFSPYDFTYDEGAYNVVGTCKGTGDVPSMMLFAHIDTEAEDYFGTFDDPYAASIADGKIFGLGSADDKGGVAMMLYALKFLQKHVPELPYDLTVMSIMGKHGGGFGTLSALSKGYTGANSIYLHPAETGHGFAEIKNISLGIIDLDITVKGEPGLLHDDLATGVNAAAELGYIAGYLEDYNRMMRDKYRFDFGSFEGQPSFVLNIGTLKADGGYGGINTEAHLSARCRFYLPLTIDSVIESVTDYLKKRCEEEGKVSFDNIRIEKGPFRATPAFVANDSPFVKLIEHNITEVTGIDTFIHQYHGGSDIRFPIVYGNSSCVGIGPSCILPAKGSGQREWMSVDDYINGIKILVRILYEYRDWDKSQES